VKRRQFLLSAVAGGSAISIAKPAVAQSMPEIKWRLTASWPKSLDTLYGSCEVFAKRVGEITDNKFRIQVLAAGEIVPALVVLDPVQSQSVEMGNTAAQQAWPAALQYGDAADPSHRLRARGCKTAKVDGRGGAGIFEANFGKPFFGNSASARAGSLNADQETLRNCCDGNLKCRSQQAQGVGATDGGHLPEGKANLDGGA
jgi:hypothetical protein